jgi:RNA polymerase sigma-70 factor, ECF subfamily
VAGLEWRTGAIVRLTSGREAGAASQVFEELLSANLDLLYRTALRLCGGRAADAEDLLQDAMLRAFEHRDALREPGAGRAWLFTILVRTNLNRARSQGRRREESASDLSEQAFEEALASWVPAERPDEWLERSELRRRVSNAVNELDDDLREVVVLLDLEGLSYREVSAMLEVPEGTVASRLFRARRALRAVLAPRAVDGGSVPRAADGGLES